MHKVAVIGDRESVYGFSAIGIETHVVSSVETAQETLIKLANEKYAVIYITEVLAEKLKDIIEKYNKEVLPAIILIPGVVGNNCLGMKNLEISVEKAVGTQLL